MKELLVESKEIFDVDGKQTETRRLCEYNDRGLLIKNTCLSIDPGKRITNYEYITDDNGNRIKRTICGDSKREEIYDNKGRLVEIKEYDGEYDREIVQEKREYSETEEARIIKVTSQSGDKVIEKYKTAKYDDNVGHNITEKGSVYYADGELYKTVYFHDIGNSEEGAELPDEIKKKMFEYECVYEEEEPDESNYATWTKYIPETRTLRDFVETRNKGAWLTEETCYDENFNVISGAIYSQGIIKYKYDNKGREVWYKVEYYLDDGFKEVTIEYDDQGREKKQTAVNSDEEESYTKVTTYADGEKLVKYFDVNGKEYKTEKYILLDVENADWIEKDPEWDFDQGKYFI